MSGLVDAVVAASRSAIRHRGFGGFVIAILALAAGSTTALVGLMDLLLVRPPAHVTAAERLVKVSGAVNYVLYRETASGSRTLDVAAVSRRTHTFTRAGAVPRVKTECVTARYFDVLGVSPVAGRMFQHEEDGHSPEPVAVLAYHVWQRDYAGRPDVVGATEIIAGRPHRVVGVAPPDFRGLGSARIDAWVLMTGMPMLCAFPGVDLRGDARSAWLTTIGRLRPGVPMSDAERDVRSLSLQGRRRAGSPPLSRELEPALSGRASPRDRLLAICLAAGAVLMLLIACANIAGMLSARALQRRREIALRVQLGASRRRVFLELFTENLMLTTASVFAAAGVASLVTSALSAFFPVLARDAWVDPRTLGVLAAFTLGAGAVAGIVPAIEAARAEAGRLWRVGQSVGHRQTRWRRALIVSQVALAFLLILGAALFTHSLVRVKQDLGYDVDGVVLAALDLRQGGVWQPAEIRRTFDEVLAAVRAVPGVETASLTSTSPAVAGQLITVLPKAVDAPENSLTQMAHDVSPEYFRTLGTPIVEGRAFTAGDRLGAPAVMIVDANLAVDLWPGEAVVGRCKSLSPQAPCVNVVGISLPRRFGSLTRREGEVYRPLAQRPGNVPQALLVRANGSVRSIVPGVAEAIQRAVPSLAFADVRPLGDLVDEGARSWRLGATLLGLFAILAVALAAVGLYAALAFTVRQRAPEIGVRIALGAKPASVGWNVVGQGVKLVGFGLLIGTAAALVVVDWIGSLLFEVEPYDPAAFAIASLVIILVGLVGSAMPAFKAARVDPLVLLRSE